MVKPIRALRQTGLRGDVSDRAYRTLRQNILDGSIARGQRLVELAICDWLQISRTPARDALRRLQSDGLVEPATGGGLQVVSYDHSALHELYVVREVLEGTAAGEAAKNATEVELRSLASSILSQENCAGDIPLFVQENQKFHELVFQAAHNRFLVRSLQALYDSVALLGPTTINTPEWVRRAINQHTEVAHAIANRDSARATEMMRTHIRNGFEKRIAALRRELPAPDSSPTPVALEPTL